MIQSVEDHNCELLVHNSSLHALRVCCDYGLRQTVYPLSCPPKQREDGSDSEGGESDRFQSVRRRRQHLERFPNK
jgi:hypothetical protein